MKKIIIWDNDGTVTGSTDPNDTGKGAKIILPGIKEAMERAEFNFIISGFKSPESEAQNFDPDKVAAKMIALMEQLPINAAAFSPSIGGVACFVIIKKVDNSIVIKKAHEDPRYKKYIGQFKKPGIGMFVVMSDIAREEFGQVIDANNSVMIGDTWHDKVSTEEFGIPFINAKEIHGDKTNTLERRAYIDNVDEAKKKLTDIGAFLKGNYAFEDHIYKPKKVSSDFDKTKEYIRIRVYQKTNWDQKNVVLTHKKKTGDGVAFETILKKEFDSVSEAEKVIQQNYISDFSFKRQGWEFEFSGSGIFVEDIEGLRNSIEIIKATEKEIADIFTTVGAGEVFQNPIPVVMNKVFENEVNSVL